MFTSNSSRAVSVYLLVVLKRLFSFSLPHVCYHRGLLAQPQPIPPILLAQSAILSPLSPGLPNLTPPEPVRLPPALQERPFPSRQPVCLQLFAWVLHTVCLCFSSSLSLSHCSACSSLSLAQLSSRLACPNTAPLAFKSQTVPEGPSHQ